MDPNRWTAINRIFHAALEMPIREREGFILTASEGDSELAQDVNKLLLADREANSYLEKPLIAIGLNSLASPFNCGEIINGRFRIERHVGQGGMGHVFEASDLDLKVRVALKVIRPEIASDPVALQYFRREVCTARAITHINVCRTFDLDRCVTTEDAQNSREL
jgi:eukaryotic-like serine/threonine-protein kinase